MWLIDIRNYIEGTHYDFVEEKCVEIYIVLYCSIKVKAEKESHQGNMKGSKKLSQLNRIRSMIFIK